SENKDAASRRLLLMSFKRHEEIYPNDRGADHKIDAPAHRSDEFPAGYSLTGCSPALPASASPTGVEYASGLAQLRGCLFTKETEKPKQQDSGSTLIGQFFFPKNGVHLNPLDSRRMMPCSRSCLRSDYSRSEEHTSELQSRFD